MGKIYQAACSECGYSARLFLGGGLNGARLPFLLRSLNEEDRAEIRKMQENDDIEHFFGENRLVKCCEHCGGDPLIAKNIVTVTDKSGRIHVFGTRCQLCGRELTVTDASAPVLCPSCGKEYLQFCTTGHWD